MLAKQISIGHSRLILYRFVKSEKFDGLIPPKSANESNFCLKLNERFKRKFDSSR